MNGIAVLQETAFMIEADSKCPDGVIRSFRGSVCTPELRLYAEAESQANSYDNKIF